MVLQGLQELSGPKIPSLSSHRMYRFWCARSPNTDMKHRQVIFVVDGVAQVSDAHAIRKLAVRTLRGSSQFRIQGVG